MLTQIRERASGWLAWVVVILITIPFALWGIQSYFESPTEAPVATVNGEEIPLFIYQNQLSRQRQELLRQTGGKLDPDLLENDAMRTRVVESLISSRLMNQYVDQHNYRMSDEYLRQRIESTPVFQQDGRFDPAVYRDLLRTNGYTTQTYEAQERNSAAIEQLATALNASAFATDAELERILKLQRQTRDADYVLLAGARFADEVVLAEDAVQQEYDDNPDAYQAPARVKVAYIELGVDSLATSITPSEAEIADTYEQTSARYKQAEVRKASHILFSLDAGADQAAADAVLAEAEAVLGEANGGADFAELAGQHSADPGSKDKGGDLGVVTRGQMVMPFEEAVFSMNADEIRGPIKTQFGYHIIKLTELQPERQKTLEQARDEVTAEAKNLQAENQFAELGEAFQNLVFEDPDSLTTTADELGLEIQQTDWFTADSGDGIADEARVRRAAFSEDVLVEDLNSAAIELGFDRMVAVRKTDHEEAHTKPLAEVEAQIRERLISEQSQRQSAELGEMLSAELTAGDLDWSALLAKYELESKTLPAQRDQIPGNLQELGDAVFSRLPPPTGETTYHGATMANGDYAVYALKQVVPGGLDQVETAERDRLRQQLLSRDGNGLYQQMQATIRDDADVSINRRQLENSQTVY